MSIFHKQVSQVPIWPIMIVLAPLPEVLPVVAER